MIKPNQIYSRERTAWGIPVSTLLGLMFCAILFIALVASRKADINQATWIVFPFAIVTGFFSGSRYKDFALNSIVHPQYLYLRGEPKVRIFHDS
jgi:hypothetical protein